MADKPERALGLWMCIALVVGNMVGSGIFLLPASLAAYGGLSLFGWVFSAAGAILLALVFARLARLLPRVGGPYAYARAGFGDFIGFLMAWGYWISIWAGNAAIAVAFTGYLGVFWPELTINPALAAAVSITAIWALTGVNIGGVRKAGKVQLATAILKLLPLIAFALAAPFLVGSVGLPALNPRDLPIFSAVTASATLTLWAFLGLESATIPAEDVVDPRRTIPRATVMGTAVATTVYLLGTLSVMILMPLDRLSISTAPFAEAARMMWGGWAGLAVAAGAVAATFGALNGWILLAGQIPMAAARDGLFPRPFSRLSSAGTPTFGLIAAGVCSSILIVMNYTESLVNQFTFIILLSTMSCLIPFVFSTMAVLLIAPAEGALEHQAPGRGLKVLALLAFAYSVWAVAGSGQDTVFWGTLLLLAGIPIHVLMRLRNA